MIYCLYEVKCNVNGKVYVGAHKTNDIDDGYMGSGRILLNALKKHGVENFTKRILGTFETQEAMYAAERELVTEEFVSREDTYNLKVGGLGGFDHVNSMPNINEIRRLGGIKSAARSTNYFKLSEFQCSEASKANRRLGNSPEVRARAKITAKKTFADIRHQQGKTNSMYGTKSYIDPVSLSTKRCKVGFEPSGWVDTASYLEDKMKHNRRWYNDGSKNYFRFMSDPLIETLHLKKGKLTA